MCSSNLGACKSIQILIFGEKGKPERESEKVGAECCNQPSNFSIFCTFYWHEKFYIIASYLFSFFNL